MEDSYYQLVKYIEKKTSFRCQSYKERPLVRRLKVRMRILGLTDFSEYYDFLQGNPREIELLKDVLTINLSYFFRNPETFDYLRKTVFPELSARTSIVLWSAGCAQGEETYSLAILAAETGLLDRIRIIGTDIDDGVLEKARVGLFPASAFQYAAPDILKKYFKEEKSGCRTIDSIKSAVEFIHHDFFEPPHFGLCDLIMCRNVLIYLGRKGQSVVLNNFHNQLKDNGYLVIGKVELLLGIPEVKLFEVVNRIEHVYRKISV